MHKASLRRSIWTVFFAMLFCVGPARLAWAEIPLPPPSGGVDDDMADDDPDTDRSSPAAALLGRLHLANIQATVMGKQAEKKGKTKDVRDLGAELVRDHGAADKRLLAFAKRQKLDVSVTGQTVPETDAEDSRSFDEKFAEGVLKSQQKSIDDVEKARQSSSDDELNAFLDSVMPMLERHRDLAQQLVDKLTKR
jgi:predicted outer membrane protein